MDRFFNHSSETEKLASDLLAQFMPSSKGLHQGPERTASQEEAPAPPTPAQEATPPQQEMPAQEGASAQEEIPAQEGEPAQEEIPAQEPPSLEQDPMQVDSPKPQDDMAYPPPGPTPSESKLVAVEVPPASSLEDYEFLPGHFDVRCVISEEVESDLEPSYRVKLKSGETDQVPSSKLLELGNGQAALQHFLNYGPDDDISSRSSTPEASSSEGDIGSSDIESRGLMRRSRRAKNTRFADFFDRGDSSEDDKASDSSDDMITAPKSKRTRGLRRGRPSKTSDAESESDFATKGTRFSTRQRRTVRTNLREKYEDDISENEEAAKSSKFYGAKEVFRQVSSDDEFRLRHQGFCDVCRIDGDDYAKGPLVFCQGCTCTYHQHCLGPRATREHLVTKVADGHFILQCRRCLGSAYKKDPVIPHHGHCMECKTEGPMSAPLRERLTPKQEQQLRLENDGQDPITSVDESRINNVDNLLFRCITCHRGFHFTHLSPECEITGQCADCSSAPGEVDTLAAWRPTDPKEYIPGYTADVMEEVDKEYLVKWKGQSYLRTKWMPGSWVCGFVNHAMRRAFFRSKKNLQPHMTAEEAIPEDFLRVDIIFDVEYSDDADDESFDGRSYEADLARVDKVTKAYVKFKGLTYEDSVWEEPPDRNNAERWQDFNAAYQDFVKRDYVHLPDRQSLNKHLANVRKQNFKTKVVRDKQPETMTGGEIMNYQQDGLNWLYYMWFKQQNAILADEMGLGKTIQVIGFLATLIQYHKCWPFLIVVPNSTCPNWRKEIKTWVPSMRVVTYYGSSFARKLAQNYEMFADGDPGLRCHVVVTSYETMTDDYSRRVLSKVPWAGLVVDEGQRLKNDKSQLYESLSRFKFPFKMLLTGTPLQNNTRELFNLLQFCDPTKDAEDLENEYGVLSKENIPELHNLIRPFFLRRTKAQVLTFLPPIAQIIVPVSMTVVQKKLYKSILAKNPQLIRAIFQRNDNAQSLKQAERHNLNNMLMQLRKCLCHPFVYSSAIEEETGDISSSHRHLVDAAGKLQLLELMLPKLKERGHRVLIFSQFLDNLDIIEDFLDGLNLMHRRLDGRMSSLEKQKQIDDYNADSSPYFAFLLSTRSGGVGINLATADTVIIMDPDFNPHQDMQALSRAHRIGQKNKVLVFQLMTKGSAEEKIMQIGKKKIVLDHVLIDRMDAEDDDGKDLESVLRHGAQALFDDDDSGDVRYDSESVDKLLDRSQMERAKSPDESGTENQFSFARVWANDNQNLDGQLAETEDQSTLNATVWEKILQEREQAAEEEARKKAENLGRGKRKRTTVDYSKDAAIEANTPKKPRRDREAESDVEFKDDAGGASDSDSEPNVEIDPSELPKEVKVQQFRRVDPLPGHIPSLDGQVENRRPCLACNSKHSIGNCRLKFAGVEHCGLCGLAHYGHSRTCPHLRSETHVLRMLSALKQSTEPPELVQEAKKYLTGIRNDLSNRRRKQQQANKAAAGLTGHATPGATPNAPSVIPTGPPVVDLTDNPSVGNARPPFQPVSQASSNSQQPPFQQDLNLDF